MKYKAFFSIFVFLTSVCILLSYIGAQAIEYPVQIKPITDIETAILNEFKWKGWRGRGPGMWVTQDGKLDDTFNDISGAHQILTQDECRLRNDDNLTAALAIRHYVFWNNFEKQELSEEEMVLFRQRLTQLGKGLDLTIDPNIALPYLIKTTTGRRLIPYVLLRATESRQDVRLLSGKESEIKIVPLFESEEVITVFYYGEVLEKDPYIEYEFFFIDAPINNSRGTLRTVPSGTGLIMGMSPIGKD